MKRRTVVCVAFLVTMCGKPTSEIQSSGTPADAAVITTTPSPIFNYDPQVVGSSARALFTVTNTGKKTATEIQGAFYLSITFSYEGGYPGMAGTCDDTLAPGESCEVEVTFSPQYVGDFEQSLAITYDNGYTTTVTNYPLLRGRGM